MVTLRVNEPDLSAELQSGETLLWVGKPSPSRIALQNREALVTAGIALAALFVVLTAFPFTAIFSFLFFGCAMPWVVLLFTLLPIYYLARPVLDYLAAERTVYALTDRRAVILKPKRGGRVVETYRTVQQIERRDLGGGKGDLLFASEIDPQSKRAYRIRKVGFIGVAQVREVERLMLNTFGSTSGENGIVRPEIV
jgi:hypothetical protein